MRTYKYKMQHHKRNRHIESDLKSACACLGTTLLRCGRRHFKIYGKCEDYKRPSYSRLSRHLTKLKQLEKYTSWRIAYSWCVQNVLKRIEFGYKKFFKGDAKRPPKFKGRVKYASQTFDGKQCPIQSP